VTRDLIRHIVPADYFRARPESTPYLPSQFAADGFIHCTREPEVLLVVANQYYRDTPGDFLVLLIDPQRVRAEVRNEPPIHPHGGSVAANAAILFPHIYGPLNRDAIVEIHAARRAPDGTFLEV
jgi:uncharacterized protein (DUF952 family)